MIGAASQGADHPVADLAMDLTPLLDVLFMVLVFFLLTANSAPVALRLDLPNDTAASALPLTEKQPIRLEIHARAPAWQIDGQPLADWPAARERLLALHGERPERSIVIAGERNAPLEQLVDVLGLLEAEQIPVARVLLDPGGRSPQTNPSETGVEQP